MNKTFQLGRYLFAISMMAFGLMHFIFSNFVTGLLPVPTWIPGRLSNDYFDTCTISSWMLRNETKDLKRIPGHFLSLQIDENPSAEELRLLLDEVRHFNRAITGEQRPRPVACFLRDAEGHIIGGVHADLWGCSAHIAVVWVAESERGQGYGSALLQAVESYAATHAHFLAYVETTSFQARPFYESLGYRVYGELDGIAEGCTLFFLRKDLKGPNRKRS
ncbi:MAG TPA: GNAT family N-acetyltransferase [Pyrinomonadaceae bacterium]|jgi:GNAT superfamily N-acetyltransferase